MASPKETKRLKRDETIDALMLDGEDHLNKLLTTVEHKHENGGIFNDAAHHKTTQVCMQALTEEELEDE